MEFHDPHTIPEPILVITGLTYLAPCAIAITPYDAWVYLCLIATTVGFHAMRNEVLFWLDCVAIAQFLARTSYLSLRCSKGCQRLYATSVAYSLVSYFAGQRFHILSFDPDWNTQMFYHSLMHLSTSYTSYKIMLELAN